MRQKIIKAENQYWVFKYTVSAPKIDRGRVWITTEETFKEDPTYNECNEIIVLKDALPELIAALQTALKESEKGGER